MPERIPGMVQSMLQDYVEVREHVHRLMDLAQTFFLGRLASDVEEHSWQVYSTLLLIQKLKHFTPQRPTLW